VSRRTNVRRIRPKEVSAVADLLMAEHEDVEELAKEICRKINEMRAEEPVWVRGVRDGTGTVLYGPYRSADDARGDSASVGTMKGPEGPQVALWSLVPPFGQADSEP